MKEATNDERVRNTYYPRIVILIYPTRVNDIIRCILRACPDSFPLFLSLSLSFFLFLSSPAVVRREGRKGRGEGDGVTLVQSLINPTVDRRPFLPREAIEASSFPD